jgi:redox-sensitive bicupin YhaK (pirin superfamily)
MSVQPATEPLCMGSALPVIANVIDGRPRDLGGVAIRRVLPAAARRMVGPFTFLDEMNGAFVAGHGLDIPPHPHIARIVLLGGAPLDGRRYIDWNFVSSSGERIEQAKRDWKERRFPRVPGDEVEFVPLPDS